MARVLRERNKMFYLIQYGEIFVGGDRWSLRKISKRLSPTLDILHNSGIMSTRKARTFINYREAPARCTHNMRRRCNTTSKMRGGGYFDFFKGLNDKDNPNPTFKYPRVKLTLSTAGNNSESIKCLECKDETGTFYKLYASLSRSKLATTFTGGLPLINHPVRMYVCTSCFACKMVYAPTKWNRLKPKIIEERVRDSKNKRTNSRDDDSDDDDGSDEDNDKKSTFSSPFSFFGTRKNNKSSRSDSSAKEAAASTPAAAAAETSMFSNLFGANKPDASDSKSDHDSDSASKTAARSKSRSLWSSREEEEEEPRDDSPKAITSEEEERHDLEVDGRSAKDEPMFDDGHARMSDDPFSRKDNDENDDENDGRFSSLSQRETPRQPVTSTFGGKRPRRRRRSQK